MDISRYLDQDQVAAIAHRLSAEARCAVQVVDAAGHPVVSVGEWRAGAAQPIVVRGQTVGAVQVDGDAAQALAYLLAQLIAIHVTAEAELESLADELLARYEEMNLLYDIGAALNPMLDEWIIGQIVLDTALQIIGGERGAVVGVDPVTQALQVVAEHAGPGGRAMVDPTHPGPLLTQVMTAGQPLLVERLDELPDLTSAERRRYGGGSLLVVPAVLPTDEGAILGAVLLAGKVAGGVFTASDQKLLTTVAGQAAIAIQNRRLVAEVRATERLRRDLEIARHIQASLLPAAPPALPGVDLAGHCFPAASIGGDYYDFLIVGDQVDLILADVSGHNVGAALLMAATRSVLRAQALADQSPAQVLAHVNRAMNDDLSRAESFITGFLARYRPADGSLRYANAGHNPPYLYRAATGQGERLDTAGIVLGVLPDMPFAEGQTTLAPGDVLVMYTDGVTEGLNRAGVPFGEARLQRVVSEVAHGAAQSIANAILTAVRDYGRGVEQYDDISLVVMKVRAAAGGTP